MYTTSHDSIIQYIIIWQAKRPHLAIKLPCTSISSPQNSYSYMYSYISRLVNQVASNEISFIVCISKVIIICQDKLYVALIFIVFKIYTVATHIYINHSKATPNWFSVSCPDHTNFGIWTMGRQKIPLPIMNSKRLYTWTFFIIYI